MNEAQLLADAISNAAPTPPNAGGVCIISDISPGVTAAGFTQPRSRIVKVTGLGGSPQPIQVFAWSQTFDDRVTLSGRALVGRRVFVLMADRNHSSST